MKYFLSLIFIILTSCSTTNMVPDNLSYSDPKSTSSKEIKPQLNADVKFQFYKIDTVTTEKEMNDLKGTFKAYLFNNEQSTVDFYNWWITGSFHKDKLMTNVIIHLPVKLHFAGLHSSVLAIPVYDGKQPLPFPVIMQKWLSTFDPFVVNTQAIPITYQSFSHKTLEVKLGIPSSIFYKNTTNIFGMCSMKDENFVLKNGLCRFNEGNDIFVDSANFMMGFKDKTVYGTLNYESNTNFPQFGDYDFGEVLIWNNEYIIYGENFDSITPFKP